MGQLGLEYHHKYRRSLQLLRLPTKHYYCYQDEGGLCRHLADADIGQHRIGDGQQRRAGLIAPVELRLAEIAELGQRVGQPGHGGLGQAGAGRKLGVAQRPLPRPERVQQLEGAGQRPDELAVLAMTRGQLGVVQAQRNPP